MDKIYAKDLIPHRDSMLILDEVCSLGEKSAIGKYTIRGDEFFLDGHYPDNKIVPGTILCEIMAQLVAAFLSERLKNRVPVLTGIKNANFKKMVLPPNELCVKMNVIRDAVRVVEADCSVSIGDNIMASAQITVAII